MLGQQFAGLENLPLPRLSGPTAPPRASRLQRDAAERLGAVYQLTALRGGGRLDREAIPTARADGSLRPALLAALGDVHGSDGERLRRLGRSRYVNRYALYKADYDAVMPLLGSAVRAWAATTLAAEDEQLTALSGRLQMDRVALDLHQRAARVAVAAGGYEPTADDIAAAYGNPRLRQKLDVRRHDPARRRYVDLYGPSRQEALLERIVRARLAPHIRKEVDATLSTLFVHPRGVDILDEYRARPESGIHAATWHVGAARDALLGFRTRLFDPANTEHVWRYPTLVLGGVTSLGLHDVAGFSDYAVAIGQVLGVSGDESLVTAAGVALFAVGLVLTGPVGLVVIGAVDLALAGASVSLAYLREHEQDLAASASAFRTEELRLAAPTNYGDTALAAAGALLSGIAFFRGAKSLRAVTRARPSTVSEALARRAQSPATPQATVPDPTAATSRLSSNRGLDGTLGATTEARAIEGTRVGAFAAPHSATPLETSIAAPAVSEAELTAAGAAATQSSSTRLETSTQLSAISEAERGVQGTGRATTESRPARRGEFVEDELTGATRSTAKRPTSEPAQRELHRELRQQLRDAIQAKLNNIDDEIGIQTRLADDFKRELAQNKLKAKNALKARRVDDVAALRERRTVVEALNEELAIDSLGVERRRLTKLLDATTADYYEALTAAAARRPSAIAVRGGDPSALFRPPPAVPAGVSRRGTYAVEHVVPRSEIFLEPGFHKLSWDQQVALFAYRRNLIKIPTVANSARGNRAYRTLSSTYATTFLTDPSALTELARLEQEIMSEIRNLIRNPRTLR